MTHFPQPSPIPSFPALLFLYESLIYTHLLSRHILYAWRSLYLSSQRLPKHSQTFKYIISHLRDSHHHVFYLSVSSPALICSPTPDLDRRRGKLSSGVLVWDQYCLLYYPFSNALLLFKPTPIFSPIRYDIYIPTWIRTWKICHQKMGGGGFFLSTHTLTHYGAQSTFPARLQKTNPPVPPPPISRIDLG